MKRNVISAGVVVFVLTMAGFVAGIVPATIGADSLAEPAAAQSGELVTQEELCAFRVPLFVDAAEEVPAGCTSVVEWLRRVINADTTCGDQWLQRGAIPECALPYR